MLCITWLFQSTNKRVWNVEAYVNGVIWPSATHGTTATKGEVVYCFWCTGVPLTAAWTKGQSNVMQPRLLLIQKSND